MTLVSQIGILFKLLLIGSKRGELRVCEPPVGMQPYGGHPHASHLSQSRVWLDARTSTRSVGGYSTARHTYGDELRKG
ncbi:hypothetical protein PISMIDRAFT_544906 [Pisolithus microcarpus 441]|uniref:Secreted protein n=1 Tax=Pisolithus microcarpus 441 TaxID=765257 RepID=A0A0C9ZNR0_9AGAM|nr:hypothetical protein PISMIDRAFT_544906 [Pisolithus microcarpus 441]